MPIAQAHRHNVRKAHSAFKATDAFWRENPMLSPAVVRGYYSEFNQEHMIAGPTPDYYLSPIDAIPYFGQTKRAEMLLKLGVEGLKQLWNLRNTKDPKERAKIEAKIAKLMKQGIDMGHSHASTRKTSTRKKTRRYRSKDDDFRRRK